MYKILHLIGTRGRPGGRGNTITKERFKEQFEKVSKDRYEEEPRVIEEAVNKARDLRKDRKATEANEVLNRIPSDIEIEKAIKEVNESAPGEDGIRICYIKNACEEMKEEIRKLIRRMFHVRANEWGELARSGIIVPLFKKGDREDPNNYRGVCLLAMCSRILARIISKRLTWWAEELNLLDENQAGFRKGRSTADVVQMMVRMEEDVTDLRRREAEHGLDLNHNGWPEARLLDLKKAYPRVSKPALWKLLTRYGMKGPCLDTLMDLQEGTEYKVRGQDGLSEPWTPARGLREGCSTSPILFNVYHQAVMRQASEARRERGGRGVEWKWVPGSSFAGNKVWEKGGTETAEEEIDSALFADDTSVIGKEDEIDEDVRITKEVMGNWEERNSDDKEEELKFDTEEGAEIRVLGSWIGTKQDIKNRKTRAGKLWGKVKNWLKGSTLSKRWQARVVDACVCSSLLYDCQARVWWKRDVKKLEQFMDRCYRYVCSNRNGQPLRQMEAQGINVIDVREQQGVKSVKWRIEK